MTALIFVALLSLSSAQWVAGHAVSPFLITDAPWNFWVMVNPHADLTQKVEIPCDLCSNVANNFIDMVKSGTPLEDVIEEAVDLCVLTGYASEFDCRWNIEAIAPTAAWVAKNNPSINIPRFCLEVFDATGCNYTPDPEEWSIELPNTSKPPVQRPEIPEGTPGLKIMHISDPHVDPLYTAGSESICEDRFICCQAENGPAVNEEAGLFGSYRMCDSPWVTLEEMFKHAAETHPDISMIFYTGDVVAHDGWHQSVGYNIDIIDQSMEYLKQYFGSELPVYQAFGNHDPFPPNIFSHKALNVSTEVSTDPFYEQAWRNWGPWLPEDAMEDVLAGGYYSATPALDGIEVIGLNDMLAHNSNWFLWSGVPDPSGQLAWLAEKLQKAEDEQRKVYLLGHVPPGFDGIDPAWQRNFAKIVNRYEGTIVGQFFGHTHYDDFRLFFNEDGEPSNAAFIAPSVTSFIRTNVAYRIFHVDGLRGDESTWALLDHETWTFDLEEANSVGEPNWFKSYSFREEYGLPDLTPASMQSFVSALRTDDSVFEKFYRHFFKEHVADRQCDQDCRERLVCQAVTTDASDVSQC